MTLDELNAKSAAAFVDALSEVFEHAPWVAATARKAAPFATVTALHEAMMAALRSAPIEAQLAFLRGHPDLAAPTAERRTMAAFSVAEQAALGLDRLDAQRFTEFERLNAAYRDRFGIPFMICVRRHTRSSILTQFVRRLDRPPEQELAAALHEVFLITRLRICGLVTGPGLPVTSGRLTTHVLDTAAGIPAAGIRIDLFELDDAAPVLLCTDTTNADGRTDALLLSGGPLRIGEYELRFHVAAHFRTVATDPPFLDVIPIRFAIAEAEAHYHVPLLVSPYGYSTYRGS